MSHTQFNFPYPFRYTAPQALLLNQVILITGASSGIGRALALGSADAGAQLIILGRNQAKLESLVDEIVARGNLEPFIYLLDLSKATLTDYEQLQDKIGQQFGKLHGLLHNAATLGILSPLEQYPAKLWHQVLHINLNSTLLLTQACLPLMRQASRAHIIFTRPRLTELEKAFWGAYGVASAGVVNLMAILAAELEQSSIRVNGIDPGPRRTSLRAQAFPGENPQSVPSPDSVLPYYLFLMDPLNPRIHGQHLKINS